MSPSGREPCTSQRRFPGRSTVSGEIMQRQQWQTRRSRRSHLRGASVMASAVATALVVSLAASAWSPAAAQFGTPERCTVPIAPAQFNVLNTLKAALGNFKYSDTWVSTNECAFPMVPDVCGVPIMWGVGCDADGFVIRLDVHATQANGSIPAAVTLLSRLTLLDLSVNAHTGVVPPFLSRLSQLKFLSLSFNKFSGQLPSDLGGLSRLEYFGAVSNALTGSLPAALANIKTLKTLALNNNQLAGALPTGLSLIPGIQDIMLHSNQFIGGIPAAYGSLPNLKTLDLRNNRLTGAIPVDLSKLANLEILDVSDNDLSGSVPDIFNPLVKLWQLSLSGNLLSGVLPPSISSLPVIQIIDLSRNYFTGSLPTFQANLSYLSAFNASYNYFYGGPKISAGGTQRCAFQLAFGGSIAFNCLKGVVNRDCLEPQRLSTACLAFCGTNRVTGAGQCSDNGVCLPQTTGTGNFTCSCRAPTVPSGLTCV